MRRICCSLLFVSISSLAAIETSHGPSGLAQLEAKTGKLDEGRDLAAEALQLDPKHFDALLTMAAIAAEFQDYQLAAT